MCWRLQQVPAERLRRDFAALWIFHVAVTGRGASGDPGGALVMPTEIVQRNERSKNAQKKPALGPKMPLKQPGGCPAAINIKEQICGLS